MYDRTSVSNPSVFIKSRQSLFFPFCFDSESIIVSNANAYRRTGSASQFPLKVTPFIDEVFLLPAEVISAGALSEAQAVKFSAESTRCLINADAT